jgi:hypothetical protein
MGGIWRITIVMLVAVAASVGAVVKLETTQPLNVSACGRVGPSDPSYSVTTRTQPDPPRQPSSDVLVTVDHGGGPVNGAGVCLSVDMVGMPMGMSKFEGQQISPGLYDDVVTFGMAGMWEGTVVVTVAGKAVVSQPVNYMVR